MISFNLWPRDQARALAHARIYPQLTIYALRAFRIAEKKIKLGDLSAEIFVCVVTGDYGAAGVRLILLKID